MQRVFGLLALSICLLAASGFSEAPESDVLVLTGENFEKSIDENPRIAVEFYAPWCGHCKKLAPEWEKAATILKNDETPFILAKIDATAHEDIATEYGVQGFPTIKIFVDGEPSEFNGPREAEGIVTYLRKKVSPLPEIKDVAELDKFLMRRGKSLALVGFLPLDNTAGEKVLLALSGKMDSILFARVSSAAAAEKYNVKTPAFVLFRWFDEEQVTFQGAIDDEQAVSAFIEEERVPVFGELTADTAQGIVGRNLPLGVLFVDVAQKEKNEKMFEELRPVARKARNSLVMCFLDNARWSSQQKRLGMNGEAPAFAIDDFHHSLKYPLFLESLTADAVKEHVEKFLAGSLTPFMKSQPIPTEQKPDEPFVLVGKSFEKEVFESDKDVMVKLYAPWCGHCKELAPIYAQLAKAFQPIATVRIADMDATENDPPAGIVIRGFPTLLFFPAGSKTPITFEGERNLESMAAFVKEKATHPFEMPEMPATVTTSGEKEGKGDEEPQQREDL